MHALLHYVQDRPKTFAAIIAFIIAVAKYKLGGILRFFAGFIIEDKLLKEFAKYTVLSYLRAHARCWAPNRESLYAYRKIFREDGKRRWVFWRSSSQSVLVFWYRGTLIWCMYTAEEGVSLDSVRAYTVRFTMDWKRLIRDVATWHDLKREAKGTSFKVVRFSGSGKSENTSSTSTHTTTSPPQDTDEEYGDPVNYRLEDLDPPVPRDPLGKLALSPGMNKVLRDAKFWHSHEKWYKEREICWRRGYGLYGRPGTGKTSLVRAIAQYLDLPVYVFDIASLSTRDFYDSWKKASLAGSRIILFEDFDAVFHGRENVAGTELTFDVILNTLDGVEQDGGYLCFLTTNLPEHLDPALTRAGRLDLMVEVEPPDYDGRYKIAYRITADPEISAAIASTDGLSGAAVQEQAIAVALEQLWGSVENS